MIEISGKTREKILKDWQNQLLASYPIKPVIEITEYIKECTTRILDKLIETYNGGSYEGVEEPIDDLMRFLAVDKNLTPGDSINMLLYLKELFLQNFPDMTKEEFIRVSNIIDRFACIAFNRYMACREDVFKLRLEEKEREKQMILKAIENWMKVEDQIEKGKLNLDL